MKTYLKLARVGMNMEEATIVAWHKRPGESFEAGDILYEFETEKVNEQVAATADGTLLEILADVDQDVAVGDRVCAVDVAEDAAVASREADGAHE